MKKVGVFVFLFLLVLSFSPLVLAANHTNDTSGGNGDSGGDSDNDKIEKGFQCLEDKVGDCTGLTNPELAYTILATPDNVFDSCVSELQSRESEDNWGNVKDTALAVLALKHAGVDTTASEEWIISQERTPTDLIWYLQQDSETKTKCNINYRSESHVVTINENKKIDRDAGECLSRAQSNFWFQVSPDCYNEDIKVQCEEDFITSLLYKNKNSPTIYVLEGTDSSPAYESNTINVVSKCFGSSSCDYESTAWAAVALLKTGHDVGEYIPYLVALSDTQKRYLPEAFIYMITNYQDYAAQLMEERKLGDYWEADNTAYNRFYDTSLALISLEGSTASQIKDSKDWLLFSQPTNGCWQNSVRDTAMVLWALTTRAGQSSGGGTTTCASADFFCVPNSECSTGDKLNNYFCPSPSTVCCETEDLKTCNEYSGEVCSGEEVCVGNERNSLDESACCTGKCEVPEDDNECESNFYSCRSSCSDSQEEASYSCDSGSSQVCCKPQPTKKGGLGFVWIMTGLIIVVMGILGWVLRDRLKMEWFKFRSKFKKGKGGSGMAPKGPGPRGPPSRPGFPPVRRVGPPLRAPAAQRRPLPRRKDPLADTFNKLKEMSR